MAVTQPPFRADHVGSLLRPPALVTARADHAAGRLDAAGLKAVEDREIERIVAEQEYIGLKAVTDGEFRRAWWHLDFLAGFAGAEMVDLEQGVQFQGTKTRAQGVRVTGKLGFDGHHPMLAHFRFLAGHTTRLPKMTIPSPSALYARQGRAMISQSAYPDLDAFFADLADVYRKAVRAFADAGCRYLQLDEVYMAMWCDPRHREMLRARGDDPDRMLALYAELLNAAMADIPAGMTITMHLCRGNFRSTFMGTGGYEPIAATLFDKVRVHGYFMEYDSERAGGFEPLRFLHADRRVVLGLVTTKSGALETKDEIKRRIEQAAAVVPLERLCLSPQCGFASTEEGNLLTEEEQWAKLRFVVDVAREVWGEL
ncbi:MAG TPA: 5-methyltetrahydropteroyltriglutamate--homocysteine S-methyltransferase [Hyphomicrobiales bacterium]|nr:5-methyltetrahydropteroyltriglutamate--homocysteine S-methyltransferase [Hyphomicrobiales bacterium]